MVKSDDALNESFAEDEASTAACGPSANVDQAKKSVIRSQDGG